MTLAGIRFIRLCQKTVLIILTLFATTASAHNKVVVIPMPGNGLKPLKNLVTVAKANGDYSDPVAALDAIYNYSYSSPTMTQVTATASEGTNDYGVYNWDTTAMPFIRNSLLKGSTNGVRIGSSGTRIVNTRIEGGVSDLGGTQCLGTYDQDLNIVNC